MDQIVRHLTGMRAGATYQMKYRLTGETAESFDQGVVSIVTEERLANGLPIPYFKGASVPDTAGWIVVSFEAPAESFWIAIGAEKLGGTEPTTAYIDDISLREGWIQDKKCPLPGSIYAKKDKYRFGFNGAEKVDEIYGEGNGYDLGARIYDPRLGRMFSRDPREAEYPWQSAYAYYRNSPIATIDFNGEGDGDKKKLSDQQVLALLDPKADSEGKFRELKKLQSGKYEFTSEDMARIINTKSDFITKNKSELSKVSSLSVNEGKLTVNLKSGVDRISLKSKDPTLVVRNGAVFDFSGLNIKSEKIKGYDRAKKSIEVQVLNVSGQVSFSGFEAVVMTVSLTLKTITYTTKRVTLDSEEGPYKVDNYVTSATISVGKISKDQDKIMRQWVPYLTK